MFDIFHVNVGDNYSTLYINNYIKHVISTEICKARTISIIMLTFCVHLVLKSLNVVLSHRIHAQTSSIQFLCDSGAWMNFVERGWHFIYAALIRVRLFFCSQNLGVRKFPDLKSKHHAFHLWSAFLTSNQPFWVFFLCKSLSGLNCCFLHDFRYKHTNTDSCV